MKLPENNPLIPEDFRFKAQTILEMNGKPELIKKEENHYEIWHY